MKSKFRKVRSLTGKTKMLFVEALIFQYCIGLLLKIVPFRCFVYFFSRQHADSHRTTPAPGMLNLEEIKAATRHAGRFSPWKNKCLVQSLAAKWMLQNRNIQSQLSLGVAIDGNNSIKAHAWLKVADFEVVDQNGAYHELYLF